MLESNENNNETKFESNKDILFVIKLLCVLTYTRTAVLVPMFP